MLTSRPSLSDLIGKDPSVVPMSAQRVLAANKETQSVWIGPKEAAKLGEKDIEQYTLAHQIMCHLCIQGPIAHSSGHPGGPLSAFTFAYFLSKRRNPHEDQPLRISPGHLSLLGYGLQWLFGREDHDERLTNPQAIIDSFRIPNGLPGHIEAGIGDIPFGTGPLGKGVSNGVGAAFGLKYQNKKGIVDVLIGDGDSQEGQVAEAMRLASHLKLDNLVVHADMNDIQLSDLPSKVVAADLSMSAHAEGWTVIEVQNGNDPAQVSAALDQADSFIGKGSPIFICYYTTMGNGVKVMEDGSNNGTKNYHGSPLSKEEAEASLKDMPTLPDLVKKYQSYHDAEHKRYTEDNRTETDITIAWKAPSDYVRTITADKGAARKDLGATHLKNLMKHDTRIVVLHADLAASGGFDKVHKDFPDRVINVGVAEANMYMMAAGMRQTGLLPITYTFAAFGTNEARANARLIDVNCGHTRCGVIHDCTHSGLSVGEDGETHQEQNYLNLPFHHTQVWMPGDSNQAGAMAERALEIIAEGHESVYIFSPRSDHPQLLTPSGEPIYGADYKYDGKADLIRGHGNGIDDVTIIASGIALHEAIKAAERLAESSKLDAKSLSIRVLNLSCIRPIDASAIMQAAFETQHLIVVEDHNSEGGIASQVADIIADFQLPCSLRRLGLTHYFPSGKAEDLMFFAGIDTDSIIDAVEDELRIEVTGGEDSFVTTIFTLTQHVGVSRFRETAKPFVERLINEKGYLEGLRELWKSRTVPPSKMPKNDELRRKLGLVTGDGLGSALKDLDD